MNPAELYQPRGVPDHGIGVRVDCAPVVDRKLDAVREHRTQTGDTEEHIGTEEEQRRALVWETHVIAWPPRRQGEAVLGDVFEGL